MSWSETVAEGEAERFEALAKLLVGGAKVDARPLHRRAIGAFRAEVVVGEVEPELRHGLFEEPATHPAYVRFSSGAGRNQSDKIADVRAIAIKVCEVEGDKIIPGLEKARTQDFLTIATPTFGFKDPAAFVDIALAGSRGVPAVLGAVIKHFGFFGLFTKLKGLLSALDNSTKSLATPTFFSALPIKLGPHAAKIRLRPIDAAPFSSPAGHDVLGPELVERLKSKSITYAIEAQVFVDEARTPVEDPTLEWPETVSPFREVARLIIPPQDSASPSGKKLAEYVEQLSFDPWHALAAHRPLGAIMRARGVAYKHAVIARNAVSELEIVTPTELSQ